MEWLNRTLYFINISAITLETAFTVIGTALILAFATALVYIFTHRKTGHISSLIVAILLLGPIGSMIVVCIGSNLARAISIGGGLALIRFRNTIEDPKALIYLFLSLAIGMACGTGFIGLAIVGVTLILLVLVIINLVKLDSFGGRMMKLTIIIPESLDFYGVFDPILKKYCSFSNLDKVRTTDYGTLFELVYRIRLKDMKKQKELLDEIRTRNGNLNVTIVHKGVDY